jgi:hypothetical protein
MQFYEISSIHEVHHKKYSVLNFIQISWGFPNRHDVPNLLQLSQIVVATNTSIFPSNIR